MYQALLYLDPGHCTIQQDIPADVGLLCYTATGNKNTTEGTPVLYTAIL